MDRRSKSSRCYVGPLVISKFQTCLVVVIDGHLHVLGSPESATAGRVGDGHDALVVGVVDAVFIVAGNGNRLGREPIGRRERKHTRPHGSGICVTARYRYGHVASRLGAQLHPILGGFRSRALIDLGYRQRGLRKRNHQNARHLRGGHGRQGQQQGGGQEREGGSRQSSSQRFRKGGGRCAHLTPIFGILGGITG